MYRVLMPIDSNVDRGLTQAEYLMNLPVETDNVQVIIIHTLEQVEDEVPEAMRSPERVESVIRVRDHLEDYGFNVRVEGTNRPPVDAIQDLAAEIDAEQIVMGGRKRSPAGKVLFGSISQSVLLNSDRPVVVTGGGG